jgi:DNA-directed RNA polymerase subunit RPC12/RpoP
VRCNTEGYCGNRTVLVMSGHERLIDFRKLPQCRCGKEMRIVNADLLADETKTHVREYHCPDCRHEMRLTVWGTEILP